MNDSDSRNADWIGNWIAQQRERLQQQTSQQGSAEPDFASLFKQWNDLGAAWMDASRGQTAPAAAGKSFDPFNVGDAMLQAWNGVSALQSSAAEQTADLFGRLPPIGLARENTEAWRELAEAHAEVRRIEHELRAAMWQVQLDALDLLDKRAREKDRRIDSFRALYDLWVECGEQVYGRVAHSDSYCKLQAALGNSSMRLRTRLQTVLEHGLKKFDLPTRSELNTLHRQVRDLRLKLERVEAQQPATNRKPSKPKQTARKRKAAKR